MEQDSSCRKEDDRANQEERATKASNSPLPFKAAANFRHFRRSRKTKSW